MQVTEKTLYNDALSVLSLAMKGDEDNKLKIDTALEILKIHARGGASVAKNSGAGGGSPEDDAGGEVGLRDGHVWDAAKGGHIRSNEAKPGGRMGGTGVDGLVLHDDRDTGVRPPDVDRPAL